MQQPVLSKLTLFWPLAMSALAGCSALGGDSCTAAFLGGRTESESTGQGLFQVIENSHLKGGWIVFDKSTCTATFEFSDLPEDDLFVVHAWTGRHCGYDVLRSNTHPSLEIHFGDGYERIAAIDDIIFRKQAALEIAKAQKASPEAVQVIEDAFRIETGRQSKKEDTGCYNSDKATADRAKNHHVFCANFQDLGYYKLFLKKDSLTRHATAYIKGSITATNNVRRELKGALKGVDIESWSNDMKRVWQIQRLKHNATALDKVFSACQKGESLCQDKETMLSISKTYFFEGETSLLGSAKAKRLVSNDGSEFGFPADENALTNSFKEEEARLRTALADRWQKHSEQILRESDTLWLHTNLDSKNGAAIEARFETVPFRAVYGDSLVPSESSNPEGLQVSQPRGQAPIEYSEKDSGTILSLFGHFPILALSGADGRQTSGSEPLASLPRASGRDTKLAPVFAEREKYDSGRQVATEDKSSCP